MSILFSQILDGLSNRFQKPAAKETHFQRKGPEGNRRHADPGKKVPDAGPRQGGSYKRRVPFPDNLGRLRDFSPKQGPRVTHLDPQGPPCGAE